MNRLLKTLILLVGASFVTPGGLWAQELDPIGVLPRLAPDWEISVDDQQSNIKANFPFRWVIFRNKKTGDFLSFATLPPEHGKKRNLETLSDTSIEIFPNGRPVWTQEGGSNDSTNVITIGVVDLGRHGTSLKGEKVLEYCFILESPDHDNLMAQGRTWVGPKGVVFAQHTSAKPITSELIQETIKSVIREQIKQTNNGN